MIFYEFCMLCGCQWSFIRFSTEAETTTYNIRRWEAQFFLFDTTSVIIDVV